jgi:hypothetical protein
MIGPSPAARAAGEAGSSSERTLNHSGQAIKAPPLLHDSAAKLTPIASNSNVSSITPPLASFRAGGGAQNAAQINDSYIPIGTEGV